MFKNRLFNMLIAIALVIVVALTAREAFATSDVVSQSNLTNGAKMSECAVLPSHLSLHTGYATERGMWVTYTEQGPAGVEGGLMGLLAANPICSR